jgi:hypothetical protein
MHKYRRNLTISIGMSLVSFIFGCLWIASVIPVPEQLDAVTCLLVFFFLFVPLAYPIWYVRLGKAGRRPEPPEDKPPATWEWD